MGPTLQTLLSDIHRNHLQNNIIGSYLKWTIPLVTFSLARVYTCPVLQSPLFSPKSKDSPGSESGRAAMLLALTGQVLIDGRLHGCPESHDLGVSKGEDLRRDHSSDVPIPIRPPEQVRQAGPPCRTLAVHRTVLQVQEKRETPPLGDVMRVGIQLRQRVRVFRLGREDPLPREIRKFRDLVGEHGLDGLFLEQSCVCRGVDAVVQQHADDLGVLVGPRKAACSALLEDGVLFGLRGGDQRGVVEMAVDCELEISRVEVARVHVREFRLHFRGGEHVDVGDSEGFKDVLLEIVVQRQSRGSFDTDPCPVDVDSVLPCLTGLVDEGLR